MNYDPLQEKDYSNFNPWPYLYRALGLFTVVISIYWMSIYRLDTHNLSKIVLFLSGAVFSIGTRGGKKDFMQTPIKKYIRRKWLFSSLGLAVFVSGLLIGYSVTLPLTFSQALHFAAGGFGLAIGAKMVTGKYS